MSAVGAGRVECTMSAWICQPRQMMSECMFSTKMLFGHNSVTSEYYSGGFREMGLKMGADWFVLIHAVFARCNPAVHQGPHALFSQVKPCAWNYILLQSLPCQGGRGRLGDVAPFKEVLRGWALDQTGS